MRPSETLIRQAFNQFGGYKPAARHLIGLGYETSESALRRFLKGETQASLSPAGLELDLEVPMETGIDIEELVARRIREFCNKRKNHEAERLIPVGVRLEGPIGIGFMGDPHIDDDGTDIEELFRHVELFNGSTEGLYAGCLGDMWNNWTGRLARLWSEQSTSAAEARALVDEFLNRIVWLFVVFGNHDAWSGHSDILPYILKTNAAVKKSSRVRLGLKFPNGRTCKIFNAHAFPGKSQWTEAYGVMKKANLDGAHHIYASGHIHTSGYTHGWHDGNEHMWHAIQVASYKKLDRYAEELNLPEKAIYNCPVALIDPDAKSEMNFIRWEFDPEEGAERLKWMRSRFNQGKSAS